MLSSLPWFMWLTLIGVVELEFWIIKLTSSLSKSHKKNSEMCQVKFKMKISQYFFSSTLETIPNVERELSSELINCRRKKYNKFWILRMMMTLIRWQSDRIFGDIIDTCIIFFKHFSSLFTSRPPHHSIQSVVTLSTIGDMMVIYGIIIHRSMAILATESFTSMFPSIIE